MVHGALVSARTHALQRGGAATTVADPAALRTTAFTSWESALEHAAASTTPLTAAALAAVSHHLVDLTWAATQRGRDSALLHDAAVGIVHAARADSAPDHRADAADPRDTDGPALAPVLALAKGAGRPPDAAVQAVLACHQRNRLQPGPDTAASLAVAVTSWSTACRLLRWAERSAVGPSEEVYTAVMRTAPPRRWALALQAFGQHQRAGLTPSAGTFVYGLRAAATARSWAHGLALWGSLSRTVSADRHFLKGEPGALVLEEGAALALSLGRWPLALRHLAAAAPDMGRVPTHRMLLPTARSLALGMVAALQGSHHGTFTALRRLFAAWYSWDDIDGRTFRALVRAAHGQPHAARPLLEAARDLFPPPPARPRRVDHLHGLATAEHVAGLLAARQAPPDAWSLALRAYREYAALSQPRPAGVVVFGRCVARSLAGARALSAELDADFAPEEATALAVPTTVRAAAQDGAWEFALGELARYRGVPSHLRFVPVRDVETTALKSCSRAGRWRDILRAGPVTRDRARLAWRTIAAHRDTEAWEVACSLVPRHPLSPRDVAELVAYAGHAGVPERVVRGLIVPDVHGGSLEDESW